MRGPLFWWIRATLSPYFCANAEIRGSHFASLPDGSLLTVGASKNLRQRRNSPGGTFQGTARCLLFWWILKRGVERSPKNNPVNCFWDGDRRFLRDVTFEMLQNVEQKSRTTPPPGSSLTAKSYANGVDLFFDGSELRRPRISAQTEKMREIVLGYAEMLRES